MLFRRSVVWCWILILTCICSAKNSQADQIKRPFTVTDDIQLWKFDFLGRDVRFSPNGRYFAILSEHGRLDLDKVENSLRFYRSEDVENFLRSSSSVQLPSPTWEVTRSIDTGDPISKDWRWLADSSGIAFLAPLVGGKNQLVLANLRKKQVETLTPGTESVTAFDIRDRNHYVYTIADDSSPRKRWMNERQNDHKATAIVGTGRSIWDLIFPDKTTPGSIVHLWAVVDGKHFEVKHDGAPIDPGGLTLSPDGHSLVTAWEVAKVPLSWETLYPPPYPSDRSRYHAGNSVHQYAQIALQTGVINPLIDAPISSDMGSWAAADGEPSWSSDGETILLPGTFLKSEEDKPSRPCIAVMNIPFHVVTCVEELKGHIEGNRTEEGYHLIWNARFVGGDGSAIAVTFLNTAGDWSVGTTEYRRSGANKWQVARREKGTYDANQSGLIATIRQGFNKPPLLIAANQQSSRMIWDPNPQLKNLDIGDATLYTWKDKDGNDRRGGLYKPSDFKIGKRYPLLIQTHSFEESEFNANGGFPVFAATELAVSDVIVLQVDDASCPIVTAAEGPCAVSTYESAASQLISDGMVDPTRIGIIGFSRSCFYVMEALTASSLHFKAASITDGVLEDYLEYILVPELSSEANPMMGAEPFGDGLQQWLKQSPGFKIDKITSPLLINPHGPESLLTMWEPYAGLYYLHKPVDLVMWNTKEHIMTSPSGRMASQSATVDWFRFWLQGHEDSNPSKAEQYKRWRALRTLQAENDNKLSQPSAVSNLAVIK